MVDQDGTGTFIPESIMFNECVNIKFKELNKIVEFAQKQASTYSEKIRDVTRVLKRTMKFKYDDNFTIGITITD